MNYFQCCYFVHIVYTYIYINTIAYINAINTWRKESKIPHFDMQCIAIIMQLIFSKTLTIGFDDYTDLLWWNDINS